MSTNHTTHTTIEPSRVEISNHARLRVMERFGVVDRAAEYVRELLADARLEDVEHVTNAQAWRVGDVTIVVDPHDNVVQTVFEHEVSR